LERRGDSAEKGTGKVESRKEEGGNNIRKPTGVGGERPISSFRRVLCRMGGGGGLLPAGKECKSSSCLLQRNQVY